MPSRRPQTIIVPTAQLIQRVRDYITQRQADQARARAEYQVAVEAWKQQVVVALEKALERAKRGEFDQVNQGYPGMTMRIAFKVGEIPIGPTEPTLSLAVEARDLALLEMTNQEEIEITLESNWMRYL